MGESDLELARQVHYAFLPEGYRDEDLEVTVLAESLLDLGGDYCGIMELPEDRVALTMCDATGHGLASALFASRINTYVLSHLTRVAQPCSLIHRLNRFLIQRMQNADMFATFCAAIIDPRSGKWDFAGAGHPPAIHYRAATRDTVLVWSQTTPVGIFEELPVPCGTTTSPLADGDRILIYTDGLLEARPEGGEPFGLERLQSVVVENAALSGTELSRALTTAAKAHGGSAFDDDVMLMTADCRHGATS